MATGTRSCPLKPVNLPTFDLEDPPDPTTFDLMQIVSDYLARLKETIKDPTVANLENVMFSDGFWRDHLFFSWDLRTLQGVEKVSAYLSSDPLACEQLYNGRFAAPTDNPKRYPMLDRIDPSTYTITAYVELESEFRVGEGVVRLFLDTERNWKVAFTIFTALTSMKDFPETVGPNRPFGVYPGDQNGDQRNWRERLIDTYNFTDGPPAVLIVGAGQAGLSVAARLKQFDIKVLVIDKNVRVGDNWRKRYDSLVLHDPVWYDHLPYLPFPKTWPIFTPKDKMGDWLERYAIAMEIPVWLETTVSASDYDKRTGKWTVTLRRTDRYFTITPRHVVWCTGHSSEPNVPTLDYSKSYMGSIVHSSVWAKPERLKGRSVIIVGAGNTAFDIAQSLVAAGALPTIVQRSTTCVISSNIGLPMLLGPLYAEDGPDAEEADLLAFSLPNAVLKAYHVSATTCLRAMDKDGPMLAALCQKGLWLDGGPDDAGLVFKYFEQGGGFYIDTGAAALIANGRIRIRNKSIKECTCTGVRLSDGEPLKADEIVLATGYQSMDVSAGMIFPCVKGSIGEATGFDEEGEFRTMFRDSGHPGFWLMGMNLANCRYYSRVLALRIAAEVFAATRPKYADFDGLNRRC
ncbi:hypothetical protein Dda_9321 [Drechslerella dactyloides]|uniref:Flavin-containing monooxygenase n=1 Tax=Drechslerella dactyloides TaxID=74499 RepID=A0AAD6NF81_DREDA|nr:hypothetical protein Dda_9321 [Drechslerella dactyloides]